MSATDSVRFDRAAEFYDRTRAIPPAAFRTTIERLTGELAGRGRCVEIGVGTGILALELQAAGVPMSGVDLSAPMVAKLVEKAGGEPPFPLVLGDATTLPFRTASFGGGLARWVFHLIPGWERAVDELVRVIEPGGTVLVNLGDFHRTWEVVDRFLSALGGIPFAVGLDPRDPSALERAFGAHGARARVLEPIESRDDTTVGALLDEMAAGQHSWSWRVPEDVRKAVMPELREWAIGRFGSLDEALEPQHRIVWRAFDLA
jgi:SAM-dependent methyltransferase